MRDLVHVRRAQQLAVEIVGPRVVRALNAPAELPGLLLAKSRAAMAAGVVERADRAFGIARDDDVVAVDLADEILTGLSRFFRSSNVKPHRPEQAIELAVEQRRVGVVTRRERARALRHDV